MNREHHFLRHFWAYFKHEKTLQYHLYDFFVLEAVNQKKLSQRISGNNFFEAIAPRFGAKGTRAWSKHDDFTLKIFGKGWASKGCQVFSLKCLCRF